MIYLADGRLRQQCVYSVQQSWGACSRHVIHHDCHAAVKERIKKLIQDGATEENFSKALQAAADADGGADVVFVDRERIKLGPKWT